MFLDIGQFVLTITSWKDREQTYTPITDCLTGAASVMIATGDQWSKELRGDGYKEVVDELDVDGMQSWWFWKSFCSRRSGEKDTALTKDLAAGPSVKLKKALAGLIRNHFRAGGWGGETRRKGVEKVIIINLLIHRYIHDIHDIEQQEKFVKIYISISSYMCRYTWDQTPICLNYLFSVSIAKITFLPLRNSC